MANQAAQIQIHGNQLGLGKSTGAWESLGKSNYGMGIKWKIKLAKREDAFETSQKWHGNHLADHVFYHFAALPVLNLYFGLPWHTLVTLNW